MARGARSADHVKDLGALMRSRAHQVPATSVLLIANLATYLAMLTFGTPVGPSNASTQLAWGANFGPATQDHQWWRLATALFVHFGFLHLALNMWALWDVGRLVERLYGTWRFLLVYVGAGVFGNLLSLVVQGNVAVSAGASGAIFGLYGALMMGLWQLRNVVSVREFRWIFAATAFFSVLMLGLGWVVPGIDNAAHGGGAIAGALWGLLLAPQLKDGPPQRSMAPFAGMALTLLAVTVVLQLPPARYRFTEELQARKAIQDFLTTERSIHQHWEAILKSPQSADLTFDQLAGQIDTHVTQSYAQSFEQLAAARPRSDIPSAQSLIDLQDYAARRTEAAHALANGLRGQHAEEIYDALKSSRQALPLQAPTQPDR